MEIWSCLSFRNEEYIKSFTVLSYQAQRDHEPLGRVLFYHQKGAKAVLQLDMSLTVRVEIEVGGPEQELPTIIFSNLIL